MKVHSNTESMTVAGKSTDQYIEVPAAMSSMHGSQVTWDASWTEDSVGESSVSAGEAAESKRSRLQVTCDCIEDALAVLNSPMNETKRSMSAFANGDMLSPQKTDSPPCHPRRSFDDANRPNYVFLRSQSDVAHDRFQLSKSEHISLSFRAPQRPRRSFDYSEGSVPLTSTRPSLGGHAESSRDVMIRPPTRAPSGNQR